MERKEVERIRELAKGYMEMACSERQQKANARFLATNDLKIVRPPVIMEEIPWHQLNGDGELNCICQDQRLRRLEYYFLTAKYRWKHFKSDTFFQPYYRVVTAIEASDALPDAKEKTLSADKGNNIISHEYEDILSDESCLEILKVPTFKLRPDLDQENMSFYTDLLGDVMPVKLCGRGYFYHAPWDHIARLRGMTNILYDFYDNPELLHAIRTRYMQIASAELDFVEKNSFVANDCVDVHCTPAYVSGLEGGGWKNTWLRTMAQPFGDVSPEMHDQFELQYVTEMSKRFAYTYYGCCEPLDKKIDKLKQIENLRKIGVSPWANQQSSAEQIGGNYVYARKPNPANVAIKTDPEVIRKETEQTVKACIKHGCPLELVLKDISTVNYNPSNLIVWASVVSDVLDEYYGKE